MANRGAGEKREEPGETPAGMAELVRIMRKEQKQQQQLMQLQMDALRGMMERNVRAEEERDRQRVGAAAGVGEQIKLTRLTETDDVEAYLTTFERLMTIGGIRPDSWALRLAPQLTGKSQQAYAAMTTADSVEGQGGDLAQVRR